MSFHTLAWYESIATATATDVQPVQDGIITIQNNHFFPQDDMDLLYAAPIGVNVTRSRFITPAFRQITTPYIRPLTAAAQAADQDKVADYTRNRLRFKGLEEIELEAYQDSGGAADFWGVAAVTRSSTPAPAGDIWTMRGTNTNTVTAQAWTTVATTWQDTLPAGSYSAIGLQYIGATAIAARLIMEGEFWRPGVVAYGDVDEQQDPIFRMGNLGEFGRFSSNRMPTLEVICNAADTSGEVYMDFVRVS